MEQCFLLILEHFGQCAPLVMCGLICLRLFVRGCLVQIWMSGQRRNENVLLDKKRNLSVVHHMLKAVALVGWRRLFPLHSKWFLSFVFSCFLSFFAQELEWESQDMTSDLLDQKLKALSAEECRSVTKYE